MMSPYSDIEKSTEDSINIEQGSDELQLIVFCDNRSKMERELVSIINDLKLPSNEFTQQDESRNVLDKLYSYITKHERILYSTISNQIYENQKFDRSDQTVGNILSNLDYLYGMSAEYMQEKQNNQKFDDKNLPNMDKIILKIWDHVNLAQQQYKELHLSDQEYHNKFSSQMREEKATLYREINSHMVTMIGIFTALSFVIFGGINSIETAFSGIENTPITKLMVIGCVWGFGLLNLVYIFLYCIAKLNNLNFKNHVGINANFIQRYQFIVIPNLVLIGLLMLSLWMYFATSNSLLINFIQWCNANQLCFGFLSFGLAFCLSCKVFTYISQKIEQKG